MVSCFLNPRAMVILFALITGLSIWEYCGLVNQKENVTQVNRFISTVAGVYFFPCRSWFPHGHCGQFLWFSYLICSPSSISSSANCIQATKDAINDWAYTMLSQLYIALPFSIINVLVSKDISFRWSDTLRHAVAFEHFHFPLDQ